MAPTLIIEDGTIVTGANSYVTETEVTTFCELYGLDSWASLATVDMTTSIIRGMAYIETFPFKGSKYYYNDPLEWPRIGVYSDTNFDPSIYDTSEMLYYKEIPTGLKNAVCRAAYEESVSLGILQSNLTSNIRREKIDVIETEYFDTNPSIIIYQTIQGFLKDLLKNTAMVPILRT